MATPAPNSITPAPTRFLTLAALLVVVAAFVSFWLHRSSLRRMDAAGQADRGSTGGDISRVRRGHRILWIGDGVHIGHLVSSPDDRLVGGVLYRSVVRKRDDMLWKRVLVVDVKSLKPVLDLKALAPLAMGFVDGRRSLAVLSRDIIGRRTMLNVFDIESKAHRMEINCHCDCDTFLYCFLGVSRDARRLVLWALDRTNQNIFSSWDAETGEPVAFAHDEYTWSGGGISPNGELLAHGGWPGPGIRISRANLEEDGHRASVSFCFRNDGEYSYRHDWPAAASYSPDSTRFLVVYNDGTLIDWRIVPKERARSEQIGSDGAFENCTSVVLSHTGNQVFYALNDGTIRIARFVGK